MFGEIIRYHRKKKGWSLLDLAESMKAKGKSVTTAALSRYENEGLNPSSEMLQIIFQVLEIDEDKILIDRNYVISGLSFRSMVSKSTKKWDLEYHNQATELLDSIAGLRFKTNPLGFPDSFEISFTDDLKESEELAAELRRRLNLGTSSIRNLIGTVEKLGIYVKGIHTEDGYEAYSASLRLRSDSNTVFRSGIILYNLNTPGERQRFTIAHELGHFFLKSGNDKTNEKLANKFASAFLMPESEVYSIVGRKRVNLTISELKLYKQHFGVSMQSIMFRLKDLEIITDQMNKKFYFMLNQLGWRKAEPNPLEQETPILLHAEVLKAVAEGEILPEDAEKEFGIQTNELQFLNSQSLQDFIDMDEEKRKEYMKKSQA